MNGIMIDRDAWSQLCREREEHARQPDLPLRWHQFIDQLSIRLSGEPARCFDPAAYLLGKSPVLAWHYSVDAISAAILGSRLVYMSWGIVHMNGPKSWLVRLVLKRASHVLVNEVVSGQQVHDLVKRKAKQLPFFIDTTYFSFAPVVGRKPFVFCPGSNDRDPDLLLGLAEQGLEIRWLVNDGNLRARYGRAHPNLQMVSNVPFAELRSLYQTCAACIMPALQDVHAAGQTTGLEAISCGAPLIMSRGRTAGIFANLPSVHIIDDHSPSVWLRSVRDWLAVPGLASKTSAAAEKIRARLQPDLLMEQFAPYIATDAVKGVPSQ